MKVEEVKDVTSGQELWYITLGTMPEKVVVDKVVVLENGKTEIYLTDGCYIPDRELEYTFMSFDDCRKACEKLLKDQLKKLKEMRNADNSK